MINGELPGRPAPSMERLVTGLLGLSREGFIVIDRAGTVLLFSSGAEQIFRYSADEVLGQNIESLIPDRFRPDHGSKVESYAQHGRDTLYMGARKKLLGQRKAGEEFPAEVSIAKLDTDEGMFFGVIVRDATEWFDAQRSLTEALKAEESANRAKSAFLATVSHEIRTPLNGILGMAQVFDQASLTPVQLRQFEVIRQSAEDLLDIVNDVLDLSKIEAGKLEIDDTDFDLEALIGAVHDVFGDLARQKGLDFRLETDDLAGRFRGDPTRIRQVLYNLVSNAVKFTAEGEIRLSAARQGDRLVLDVKDTGEGISAEAQRRLFKPFMQADNSVTRKHGGTGLGLAICRRLVDLMGGVISVRSRPGQGSTFRVELPLNMVQAAEAEAESPLAGGEIDVAADIPALRVLAAEDNPTRSQS